MEKEVLLARGEKLLNQKQNGLRLNDHGRKVLRHFSHLKREIREHKRAAQALPKGAFDQLP